MCGGVCGGVISREVDSKCRLVCRETPAAATSCTTTIVLLNVILFSSLIMYNIVELGRLYSDFVRLETRAGE